MRFQSPIQSFVDQSIMPIPAPLREIWELGDVHISSEEPASIRVQANNVGTWCVCSVKGSGLTCISNAVDFAIPPEFDLLVLTGSGQYRVGPERRNVLGAHAMSLVRLNKLDQFLSWGNFCYAFIMIPCVEMRSFVRPDTERGARLLYDHVVKAGCGQGAILSAAAWSLCREALRTSDSSSLTASLSPLKGLISATFDESCSTGSSGLEPARIDTIRSYLQTNLVSPTLCPRTVASDCGMSERQLYREFSAVGESFSNTLRGMRLEAAAHLLLAKPQLPVNRVAHDCGFTAPLYFSQSFRALYGVSPRTYRKQEDVMRYSHAGE